MMERRRAMGEDNGLMSILAKDIESSREYEMALYLASMSAMYSNAMAQNEEVYDTAMASTDGFSRIDSSAILQDSRIIRIMRYAVAPSISQMKFGQMFGLKSVKGFEENRISPGSAKHRQLKALAPKMAEFVSANLDAWRFKWIRDGHDIRDMELAHAYARKWTCSIAADQNASTKYRNWRKDQQEQALAAQLTSMGYVKSGFSGTVKDYDDINIGEFTTERKVKGRTIQKADAVIRSKRPGHPLVLVEAKAVGVELDSTKRIKECCDKASDWGSSKELAGPSVVAVIAGFFTAIGVENLLASGVHVVWEHRLSDLKGVL